MWQQPKTDWQSSDFFNIEDYNRIKGNLNGNPAAGSYPVAGF